MQVYALVETSAAAVSSLNRLDQLEKEVGASFVARARNTLVRQQKPASHPIFNTVV